MPGKINSAADYLRFWQSSCASFQGSALEQVYFHHAEQFFDGEWLYSREKITDHLKKLLPKVRLVEADAIESCCQSRGSGRLLLVACGLELEWEQEQGGALLAMAEVCDGRIKREWVQLEGAPATSGSSSMFPPLEEPCGFSGYPVSNAGQAVLAQLHKMYNHSGYQQVLVEHLVANEQQVFLLWYAMNLDPTSMKYSRQQGLSLYTLQQGSRPGRCLVLQLPSQLETEIMPGDISLDGP